MLESIKERQILIITGLRRVGKTTLLYQAIEKLLESENPNKILYFSFDESSSTLKEVLEFYEKRFLKSHLRKLIEHLYFLMKYNTQRTGLPFLN
ncbi:MAG: AAA family ATPase, partial [Nitrososphaerales archaeon]